MIVIAKGGPVDGGSYTVPEEPTGKVTLGYVHERYGAGKTWFTFNKPSPLGYQASYNWDGKQLTFTKA